MTLPEQIQEWAAARRLTHQQHTAGIAGTAVFGAGHAHRYALTRTWEPDGTHAVFVLLNPSVATADQNDPTVRRLIGFARREGHGGLVLANLFAVRCTNPYALTGMPDTVGQHNDDMLQLLAEAARDITLGWGTWGALQRAAAVEKALTGHGARLWALGTTKDGYPRHPLYLAKTSPLQRYEPGAVR
ncbi:DUF1643 domain-containing protein [Streptomyces sp. NBC_01728]|uniref:DUF1643 domain-containing protein n=1 Tax=unclassified Streptomyces TaxID=2593676 RepID=UPI002258E0CC|nr:MULTISPECIES: DUF1643 domain-containing protein [unclassified Streptomyces]MCX4462418.1 DUF1643 domain-containing protein [Streptomyces sp. NBC_01719]MCX4500848.1 DUF1643 domain-containing protein [Streptomyces sp. NBC_01728]